MTDVDAWPDLLARVGKPLGVVSVDGELGLVVGGRFELGEPLDGSAAGDAEPDGLPLLAWAPAARPEALGDPGFRAAHGLRYAYMTGAMANGIASTAIVIAAARAGMLGSYGAAGQPMKVIDAAITEITSAIGDLPFAFNLIHSPNEPAHEAAVVDLYLKRGVALVEASAYLDLTLPAARYRTHGIHRAEDGSIVAPNRIIAKASRIEVATRWFSPPPAKLLQTLVEAGDLTAEQAELASQIPMAEDLTAEADSGGHTDNRPLVTLLPTMLALRDRMQPRYGEAFTLRVGAAGGIATPWSAAAALAMGAAYVVTGTVNQACVESGSCDAVRQMLAEAEQADVIMAPAADMFEMGVKLQVLKRGTMFAMRAAKLYELYRAFDSLEAIPADQRQQLEKTIFKAPLQTIWEQTEQFWQGLDPSQLVKARQDPRHRMALVFRWYLGLSSRWANAGQVDRKIDYQVWCGPAMGAFNEWARDTFLAAASARRIEDVAMAILHGAALVSRLDLLRQQGVRLPASACVAPPRTLRKIEELCA